MDESRPEGRKSSDAPSGGNPAGEPTRAARTVPASGRAEIDQGMEFEVHLGADSKLPQTIGRFSVQRRLGRGSFGNVLLAHDTQLDRPVALKFPRIERITSQTRLGDYIAEARSAARLRHPGIVPVYDVNTDEGDFFIVLEYVEGRDLAQLLLSEKLSPLRCVEVMIEIAEAVSYAHEQGLVHRDLKPANILVDSAGHPHVTDFGLAIHEKGQRLLRGQVAGTPYYMSPEQVRGETHRLDGRTDIWSLGVVLYEMLTARRPFSGETTPELFDEIEHREARPPRQVNRRIPRELERICLKCLSKRMADRYRSASELADELRDWRGESTSASGAGEGVLPGAQRYSAPPPALPPAPSESRKEPVRVIPKGLRSFDAEDAHFFLDLLPGPFGREGLPESVRFWKTRIDEADPDKTFAVGLLFGPSGCGKTSLVKAGLIPRLGDHVRCAYVEATHQETEARLIRGLRRACSLGPDEGSLVSLIIRIREGEVLSGGEKVVIILDQFEQWLHAWQLDHQTELVRALRHCDGKSVQCLLLVRDGFAMSAMRLMKALEIPVSEGRNYATVDRFDLEHATEVLAHFGRAFGRLPEDGSCSAEQRRFLSQAVEGLSEHGQVVPVRLALFADMFRGKPWNPASLKKVGGTEGTGVAFLEETLGASAANPTYRLHHEAARRVLRALLPEQGTNIRGHMLSHRQLLDVSGYARRPQDFEDLLRILDIELRLITPGDPREETEEKERADSPAESRTEGGRYQLTHDYLVPALREWLGRKQRETLRGRASLLVASQAELWNARPERRYLPSFVEWGMALLFTRRSEWTDREGKMMRHATWRHLMTLSTVGVLFLVLLSAGLAVKRRIDQHDQGLKALVNSLISELLTAEWDRVPGIADDLGRHWQLSRVRLAEIAEDPSRSPEQQIRAHVVRVRHEAQSVPPLVERLMAAPADGSEYCVLYDALPPYSGHVVKTALREIASSPGDSKTDIERTANAAVTLVRLGRPKHLWSMLNASGDPGLRTALIHRVSTFGVDVETLEERLRIGKDPAVEQAILLALGEYPSDSLPPGDRQRLVQQCLSLYRTDPDPGVHAGAEWLLRKWGHEKEVNDARRKLAEGYRGDEPTGKEIVDRLKQGSRGAWYVNSQGHTMIAIWMPVAAGREQKSPARHAARQTAGRIVALSAHEVTIEQYETFAVEAGFDVNPTSVRRQCPVNCVNWYDAARYCRWLSDKEHISPGQNCYPPVEEIGPRMELSGDFRSQTGYRLPTEAEWEFACRAGTTASRFFGEDEQMLDRYAWYERNSKNQLWPVGWLKPNPLGFFDVYGNVFEWCHPPSAMGAAGEPGAEGSECFGAIRGGAYNRPAKPAASHEGERFLCSNRTSFVGFRIARTIREQQE